MRSVQSIRTQLIQSYFHSVWNEIVTSCLELASFNARDTIRQLEYAGVTYVQGYAAFADSGGSSSLFVTATDNSITTLSADKILIATGSTPFRPGGIPFDGKRVFDSDSINTLSYLPKSVAITGSGIIAIEFAKIFKNLGSDVTLIIRDNIPRNALMKIGLDKDISATLVADLVSKNRENETREEVCVCAWRECLTLICPSFTYFNKQPYTYMIPDPKWHQN